MQIFKEKATLVSRRASKKIEGRVFGSKIAEPIFGEAHLMGCGSGEELRRD